MQDEYVKIIDLGMHPFADTFVSKKLLSMSEPIHPLECFLNKSTGEIRLGISTIDDDRYNLYDYSYTSSNSEFAKNHWIKYSKEVLEKTKTKTTKKIVEIGSNDGFLSEQFKMKGHNIVGVDPSRYMSELAATRGIKTYTMLFNSATSDVIKEQEGLADLIVANNVVNHANDTEDFMRGVSNLLKEDGCFVFELPYWYHTICDNKFDQIYHEHVTYFTVKYSYNLLARFGFEIFDIEVVDYHGGSLRIYANKTSGEPRMLNKTLDMIKTETSYGLFEEKTYRYFMKNLENKRNNLLFELYKVKTMGYNIIGVGAAAKANTFLNYYNLDYKTLDYITDASEHKQGKYTPITRIPIVGDEIFNEYDEVYALILSWNISERVKENIRSINKKTKFILP
tara:strand:- start:894 stop:2078 length:1185 start_codon:yes stop_codon:yes gene_type:complete